MEGAFTNAPQRLDELLVHLLRVTCDFIGLTFEPTLHSSLVYDRSRMQSPGDWALAVSHHLGARGYLNPSSGQDLFDRETFRRESIGLMALSFQQPEYDQRRAVFEPNLSIIDVMMFNEPEEITRMLDAAKTERLA